MATRRILRRPRHRSVSRLYRRRYEGRRQPANSGRFAALFAASSEALRSYAASRTAMNAHPIVLVLGEPADSASLCRYLANFALDARAVGDARSLFASLARESVALVVLDLMAGGVDGLALLRAVRANSNTGVILLAEQGSAADRVVGLEMGADDCIDQPFLRRELVARIQTVLRRTRQLAAPAMSSNADLIRFDGWELDRSERRLRSPAGRDVALSTAEFRLLDTFLQAPRRVVSRDHLMSQARDRSMSGLERSIDLLVSRLRQKLGADGGSATPISTVRGLGYRFDVQSIEGRTAKSSG
jgi:two-component system OmpR family response regulator